MLEIEEIAGVYEGVIKASLMQVKPIEAFRTVSELIEYVNASKGTLSGNSLTDSEKGMYLADLIALLDAYLTKLGEQAKFSIDELEHITGKKDVTTAIIGGISAAVAITLPIIGTLIGLAFSASNSFSKKQAVQIISINLERMKSDVTRVLSLKDELLSLAKKKGVDTTFLSSNTKTSVSVFVVALIALFVLKN